MQSAFACLCLLLGLDVNKQMEVSDKYAYFPQVRLFPLNCPAVLGRRVIISCGASQPSQQNSICDDKSDV